jgi:hypothetical protein
MRTSFHHQPEAQHPNFQLSTSWQADYPIFRQPERPHCREEGTQRRAQELERSAGACRNLTVPKV